ncbi:MAG TPA: hypothetical protein VMD02_03155 [Candidatus Omnitrophota bacterium]|nr:hypothetical protein [Candidatus Omnitrophota bacterium]
MADQQFIAPIGPALGSQSEAVAGNKGVVFTATDRKVIEERVGEMERGRTFRDALLEQRDLAKSVENDDTTVEAGTQIEVELLEKRRKDHAALLSHALPGKSARRVEPVNPQGNNPTTPPAAGGRPEEAGLPESEETVDIGRKAAQIAHELELPGEDIVEKFQLDEKDLYNLVFKIKDLHLKRLLTNDRREYHELTETIRDETLAAAKPEAKEWIDNRLNILTLSSVQYKLKLLESLKAMGWSDEQRISAKWLKEVEKKYSK